MKPKRINDVSRPALTISRVSAPKSYELLAANLRNLILSGEIAEGDHLPTERELVEQSGLSRGSVREALRVLTAEGLVKTRRGRAGGNIATMPSIETFGQLIQQFVVGRKLPLHAIHEAREIVEPALARLAAERRTEKDLQHLDMLQDELVREADTFSRFSAINIKWHIAVAAASRNELLATFMKSLATGVAVATTTEGYNKPEIRSNVIKIHSRINEAIRAKNAAAAERLMRAHTSATTAEFEP